VHPAFALTRTRLTETRSELETFFQADKERLAPSEADRAASAVWVRTVARASGIEGVYTGMENVLKELLNVVDKGVFATSDSFHAQLLAQASAAPQGLPPASLPLNRLQIRLNRNTSWAKPTIKAAMLMNALRSCADAGMKAVSPMS
jgi:hypothetical protein